MTSSSYQGLVRNVGFFQSGNSASTPLPDLTFWSGAGYGWNPYFFNAGFFCDPFTSPFFPGSACFSPFAFSGFGFDSFFYSAAFGPPFYISPYYGNTVFYNPWIPSAFFGLSCPFCSTVDFNPFAFGLDGNFLADPYLTPLSASSLSSDTLAGLVATSTPGPSITRNDSGIAAISSGDAQQNSGAPAADSSPSTAQSESAAPAKVTVTGQPIVLVFADGSTAQATQYWLDKAWKFNYVTPAGDQNAIPVEQLDIMATMAANQKKGVQFQAPPSPSYNATSAFSSVESEPDTTSSEGEPPAPARSETAAAAKPPAPLVTLVFRDGRTIQAREYWLGNDLRLHYVTPDDQQFTSPVNQFDMRATMAANQEKGARMLSPSGSTVPGPAIAPQQPAPAPDEP